MGEEANTSPEDLRELLAHTGTKRLRDLLDRPEIKSAMLRFLADIGCRPPANHLALLVLDKALLGAATFLGHAAASQIEALALRIPPVRRVLTTLIQLDREAKDKEALRELLTTKLGLRPLDPPALKVDETTRVEVVQALYQMTQLEGLSRDLADLLRAMQTTIREELAQIDAAHNEPVLGWSRQWGPLEDRSVSDTLRYNSGQYRFLGRTDVIEFLSRFLGDLSAAGPLARFSWLLITGQAGEGKSRVAYEFTDYAREQRLGWNVGAFDHDALSAFDPSRWIPRRPTCLIIDYPAQVPKKVNALLAGLQRRSNDFDWPVRVLLLERDTGVDPTGLLQAEWFRQLLPEDSTSAAIRGHAYRHNGKRLDNGWPLPPMDAQAIVAVMRERLRSAGEEPPSDRLLLQAALRIDPRMDERVQQTRHLIVPIPRPLFAMAAAEALLLERQNTGASYATLVDRLDRTNVLKTLIERDRAKRWRFAGKGSDDHVLALHETLYVLATFCLGLPRDRLPELPLHTQTWLPDLEPKGAAPLDNALLKVMSGARDDHIPALEPDILGEFFVLDYLASPETQPATAQSVCDAAFSAAGPNAAVFLVRCVADFPERVLALRFLQPALAAGVQAVRNFATACPDLSAFLAREDHWERVDALLEQLATFRASFQNDREIALQEAKTLFSVIGGAVSKQQWMRTQVLLKRLDDLRNTLFPDDPVVALAESDVILKAVRAAGAANEWRCVGVAFDCMDNILQRTVHQSDPELILQNAYTTMAATAAAAEAGEWTQLETRLARLQSLCAQQSLCDSGDIAQALVASLCLTLLCAGAATQWVCVQTALTCLDSLRSHPSLQYDATMAKCEVDVAVTIIEHAAKSGHWTWVEHMEHRSTKLALSFRDRGVLVMLAGAHAMVSGYSQRRYHGLEPNESQSAAAAGAAGFITDCASAPDSHHELTELALQVIQDSHSRFPQTDTIARVYRRCRERGFNFTPAPWDVVRDPR